MTADGQKKKRQRSAAALRYDRAHDMAPRVLARGHDLMADRIIAVAKEHGIPITRDPDLVAILAGMEVNEHISPALYEVVAELLVFIYRLKERWMWEQEHGPESVPLLDYPR